MIPHTSGIMFADISHPFLSLHFLVSHVSITLLIYLYLSLTQGTSCLLRWVRNIDDELHALIAGKAGMCKMSNEILSE